MLPGLAFVRTARVGLPVRGAVVARARGELRVRDASQPPRAVVWDAVAPDGLRAQAVVRTAPVGLPARGAVVAVRNGLPVPDARQAPVAVRRGAQAPDGLRAHARVAVQAALRACFPDQGAGQLPVARAGLDVLPRVAPEQQQAPERVGRPCASPLREVWRQAPCRWRAAGLKRRALRARVRLRQTVHDCRMPGGHVVPAPL